MTLDDPTTEEGWAELSRAAARRMRAAMAKIDHDRRAELIDRKARGEPMMPDELAELESLQRACDDALAEADEIRPRYFRWRVRRIGGDGLLARLEGTDDPATDA